jgi:hypothetical protein
VTDATVCVTGAGGVADVTASGVPAGEVVTGVVPTGEVVMGGAVAGGAVDDAGATADDGVEVTASTVFETGVVTLVSSEPTDPSSPEPSRPEPAPVPLVESEPACTALEEGVAAPMSAAEADIAPNASPSATKPPAAATAQSSRRNSLLGGAGAMARSIDALPPMQTLV